jgi:superfamily II DNA or RNA helicase
MSMIVKRSSIAPEFTKELILKCYIKEDLNYIQQRNNAKPKIIRMYSVKESEGIEYVHLPLFLALKCNFPFIKTGWYNIQPIIFIEGQNLPYVDKTHDSYKEFIGTFRDYQTDVIEELLEQLNKYSTTSMGLPPGWGKTMGSLYLGWRLGLRICIVFSLGQVLKGWKKTCSTFTPFFKVWVVGEGDCPDDVDIILCMSKRFKYIPNIIKNSIGTLILDEVHMLCTETRVENIFLNVFPRYVIAVSATIEKQNGFHRICHLMVGEHGVFRVSKVPYNIYIVDTNIRGEEEIGANGLISSKLKSNLVSNKIRQDIVLNILMNNCEHHKIMCLRMVKTNIDNFADRVRECGITCDTLYGSKSGFKNSQVLIGTQQKFGTGTDEETACTNFFINPIKSDLIIFENTTPNKDIYEQTRGRVMRAKRPAVIFLRDQNASSKRHIKTLMPWFKETNGTVIEIKCSDLILPIYGDKIYTRITSKHLFYRILTKKDYDDYLLFDSINNNELDLQHYLYIYSDGNDILYEYQNNPFYKNKECFVITITNIVFSYRQLPNKIEYISMQPIFRNNIICVSKL